MGGSNLDSPPVDFVSDPFPADPQIAGTPGAHVVFAAHSPAARVDRGGAVGLFTSRG